VQDCARKSTVSPQNSESVQTRTLRRAADTLGSVGELATRLDASEAEVGRWIAGTARPPQVAFLKALDIVAAGRGKA
jgi:DNA-binding transcriptional regulator YiaG